MDFNRPEDNTNFNPDANTEGRTRGVWSAGGVQRKLSSRIRRDREDQEEEDREESRKKRTPKTAPGIWDGFEKINERDRQRRKAIVLRARKDASPLQPAQPPRSEARAAQRTQGARGAQGATTVGRLMFESIVPAEFRGEAVGGDDELVAEKVNAILEQIAHKRPDLYKDISHKLLRLGAKGSVETNTSFSLDDLEFPGNREEVLRRINESERKIDRTPDWTPEQKSQAKMKLWREWGEKLPNQIFEKAMNRESRLARMVASGARGNRGQLNSNIGMDLAVSDSKGRQIPIPIKNSYSKGLTPAEYFAASYGTRLGVVATKFSCTGDTEVRMADGTKRKIRDILPGDFVAGADRDGKAFPVKVLNLFDHGIQPCSRYKFRIHNTGATVDIEATKDHKMLAKILSWGRTRPQNAERASQIPLGKVVSGPEQQYVAIPAQTGLEIPGENNPFAMSIGLILGGGYPGDDILASLSPKDLPLPEEEREALEETSPEERVIPEEVSGWDNKSVARLLGGLFSAEGFTGKKRKKLTIKAVSPSLELLEQARDLLAVRFGIFTPDIRSSDTDPEQWTLRIYHLSAVRRFLRSIPLIGRKRLEAEPLYAYLKRKTAKEEGTGNTSGQPLRDMCDGDMNVFYWVGAEDIGPVQTYDIEVDHPDHLFILANGMITSNSVQDGGYFSKQINAAAGDLIVTEDDCGSQGGLPVDPGDRESIGSVLARDFGGVSAGTVITPKILSVMSKKAGKDAKAVVRSPISCRARNGGLCRMCSGVRDQNKLPDIGDNVGYNAASGLSEPVSQALLCLAEGTLVRMADGSAKAIEEIEPGEMVMGSNYNGKTSPTRVVRRYSNGVQPCMSRTFEAQIPGRTLLDKEPNIICTDTHKILSGSGPVEALKMEDPDSKALCVWNRVGVFKRREWDEYRDLPTYDIEVEHPSHMFVLACGLIVSNSTKHTAGVASAGGASQVVGFPQIDALAQVPSTYPNAATLSEVEGRVEKIEEAPQGGSIVQVGGERHYIPPDRELLVKVGNEVESGDALSTGVPNPADVVKHKGVGAGRAYFVSAFMQALKDNGTRADRRNTEVLARALVNHVRVGDEFESKEFMPDEIVEFSRLESSWVPSAETKPLKPKDAGGMYLQKPSLHYTIGTKITPSVAKTMESAGEKEVFASPEAPSFSPIMVRAMDNPAYKDDFMLHTGQSYVKRNLLNDIQSGKAKSDIHGKHLAPGLARGVEFGRPPKGVIGY